MQTLVNAIWQNTTDNTIVSLNTFTKELRLLFEAAHIQYTPTMDLGTMNVQFRQLLNREFRIKHDNETVKVVIS